MMTLFFFFLIICCIDDLNGQSRLCGNEYKPAVEICKVNTLTAHKLVYITTTGVPRFQQTLCECLITSKTLDVDILFSFVDSMVPQSLSFGVNDNEINSEKQHNFTTGDRSLTLSVLTHDNYTYEGACLKVSSGMKITPDTTFSAVCDYRPVNSLTLIATSSPYPSSSVGTDNNIRNTTDKDEYRVIIPVVAASIAAFICLAVVILIVISCRRHRYFKEKRSNNQSVEVTISDVEPNTGQRECDTNTYEKPDQNVYEGLDRQGNGPSGEMYQHLFTETNDSDCESKIQNLSHRQSDTNSLENEHNNTPDKDSICDSIHRENSSNEYESYKANATDQMYETLQKDNGHILRTALPKI